jgi:hypothetical protein
MPLDTAILQYYNPVSPQNRDHLQSMTSDTVTMQNNAFIPFYYLYCFTIFCKPNIRLGSKVIVNGILTELHPDRFYDVI